MSISKERTDRARDVIEGYAKEGVVVPCPATGCPAHDDMHVKCAHESRAELAGYVDDVVGGCANADEAGGAWAFTLSLGDQQEVLPRMRNARAQADDHDQHRGLEGRHRAEVP